MIDKETLVEWDKRYLWHPFTQMQDWLAEEPIIIERGEGCYLIDIAGNRYIDGIASMWTNVHGHNHPALNTALKGQIDKIAHAHTAGIQQRPRDSARTKTRRTHTRGIKQGVLLRQRFNRGRSRLEDSVSVLATQRRAATKTVYPF